MAPYPELKVSPEGPEDHPSKGEMYAIGAKYFEVFVASGFCAFLININTLPLKDLVSAATGWDLSVAELLLTGERIQTLRQVFNVREGICPDDFSLPRRLQESPSFGPLKGVYIDFNKHREAYYHTMNWDPKTGYPLEACLKKLGLAELVGSLPDV